MTDNNTYHSSAIPMPASHIPRTQSELRLSEDIQVAKYIDNCMFNRLVTGIRRRQQKFGDTLAPITDSQDHSLAESYREENERAIGNIIMSHCQSSNMLQQMSADRDTTLITPEPEPGSPSSTFNCNTIDRSMMPLDSLKRSESYNEGWVHDVGLGIDESNDHNIIHYDLEYSRQGEQEIFDLDL